MQHTLCQSNCSCVTTQLDLAHTSICVLFCAHAHVHLEGAALSELFSIVLFVAAIAVYAVKAGRNVWWFSAILLILCLYIVLNVTFVASNYFTGEGINDAVLYTLTSSMTGAGIGKYILPGVGVLVVLGAVFGALTWILRRRKGYPHHFGYSLSLIHI